MASCLLLRTELNIKEIAHTIGYRHPPSFVRAFKKKYGTAPGQYRIQNVDYSTGDHQSNDIKEISLAENVNR